MQDVRFARRALRLAMPVLCAYGVLMPAVGAPSVAMAVEPQPGSTGVFSDFLAGRFAESHADPDFAAGAFLRGLRFDPSQPELLREAFLASAMSGRADALGLAQRLPGDAIAQLLLANDAARRGDWQAAETRFQALPRDGLARALRPLLIAWAQQGAGQTDAALATLNPLAGGEQFRTLYSLHAGLIADLVGREQAARAYYRQTEAALGAPSLRLAQVIASFQARHGQHAEAMRTLAQAADGAPETAMLLPSLAANLQHSPVATAADGMAEAYLAGAGTLQQQNMSDFALLMLDFALSLRPDFTAARVMAADIVELRQQPERALQMLGGVATDDPLEAMVRLHRARLAQRAGHTGQAMRELDALARDCPNSPLPYAEEGDILRSQDRFADAVAAYNRAISRVPAPSLADWVLFYERGVAYERTHRWASAEADFKRAIALAPDEPLTLNYLGYSWADMGVHLKQARQMIEKAAQLEPNDGAIQDSLGWVMLREGDTAEAVPTLERAVELMPEDPTLNAHLGDAYFATGRKLEASYQWRRALTLHPQPSDAEKLQAKLDDSQRQVVGRAPSTALQPLP